MARLQLSGLVGDIRGKVGGTVFTKNLAGAILKRISIPVNSRTVLQGIAKNITFNMQQEWIRLTPEQRRCWEQWTKLNPIPQIHNKNLRINAQQTFIKLNFYRQAYGLAVIQDPVFNVSIISPMDASLNLVGSELRLLLERPLNDSTELFVLLLTFRTTRTLNNPGSRFRLIVFEQVPGVRIYQVQDPYKAIFGIDLQPGDQIFMRFTTMDRISGKPLAFQQKRQLL